MTGPSRRIVFTGLGSLGIAVALAGCGGSQTATDSGSAQPSDSPSDSQSSGSAGGSSGGGADTGTLVAAAEVPVGGGVILTGPKIVVTQPTSGTFKAFSAICTHQGFLVTDVAGGTITCNHHGSRYSATTGAVEQGPAPAALAEVAVTVKDGQVVRA